MSTLTVKNLQGVSPTNMIMVGSGHKMYVPGHVIQVKQTVKTDTWSLSSTTPTDITGLSVSITPSSTSSKILILVDLKWSGYGHADAYLLRDSTKIYYGDLYGNQTQAALHQYFINGTGGEGYYSYGYGNISYLDSPTTTSTLTYKLQAATPYSGSYGISVNYIYENANYSYNARAASSITVMEIAQ